MTKTGIDAFMNSLHRDEVREKIAATKAEIARLDAAEAERARVVPETPNDADDDWTQAAPLPELRPGDWVSFFGSCVLHVGETLIDSYSSVVTRYGLDLELTEALLRHNAAFFALIDEPEAQQLKWRRDTPFVVRGKWDERTSRWERGSVEEARLRDIARAEAFKISDPDKQRQALRKVDDTYGLASTSKTLAAYRGGSGR